MKILPLFSSSRWARAKQASTPVPNLTSSPSRISLTSLSKYCVPLLRDLHKLVTPWPASHRQGSSNSEWSVLRHERISINNPLTVQDWTRIAAIWFQSSLSGCRNSLHLLSPWSNSLRKRLSLLRQHPLMQEPAMVNSPSIRILQQCRPPQCKWWWIRSLL